VVEGKKVVYDKIFLHFSGFLFLAWHLKRWIGLSFLIPLI